MGLSYFFIKKLRKSAFNVDIKSSIDESICYKRLKDDLLNGVRVYKSEGTLHYGIGNICHAISMLRANEGMPIITHRDKDPNKVYYCLYNYADEKDQHLWKDLEGKNQSQILNLGASGYFQNLKSKDQDVEGQLIFDFCNDGSFMISEIKR